MESTELKCKNCVRQKFFEILNEVKIITRFREITITTFRCPDCGNIDTNENEKIKKDVPILD